MKSSSLAYAYDVQETDIELMRWVFNLVYKYIDNMPDDMLPDSREFIVDELDALEVRVLTNIRRTTAT